MDGQTDSPTQRTHKAVFYHDPRQLDFGPFSCPTQTLETDICPEFVNKLHRAAT